MNGPVNGVDTRELDTELLDELAAVRGELSRVDAKCGTLTGLAGAAVAFLATQVGDGPLLVRAVLGLAGLPLALAAVVLLAGVLRPRLGSSGFRRWAALPEGRLAETFDSAQPERQRELYRRRCQDLQFLSRICDSKNLRVRQAVDLMIVGVVLIAVGLVAGAIA